MKAINRKDLIALLLKVDKDVIFEGDLLKITDNLGDDYRIVDGRLDLVSKNKFIGVALSYEHIEL